MTSSAITQASSGNVGIGVANPQYLFSVSPGSMFGVDAGGNSYQTNPVAATSSANNSSPFHFLDGNYWTGAASATDAWSIQDVLGGGSNPTSYLTFHHAGTTGPFAVTFLSPINIFNQAASPIGINSVSTFTPTVPNQGAGALQTTLKMQSNGIVSNNSPYVNDVYNTIVQYSATSPLTTGYQSNANVEWNTFQYQGGSTGYGLVTATNSYAGFSGGSGNIANLALYYGMFSLSPSYSGTIGNLYGLYLPNMAGATNNYAIYSLGGQSYFAGNVGIGTSTPGAPLEVKGGIKLTAGSVGGITFADGTTQSTAATLSSLNSVGSNQNDFFGGAGNSTASGSGNSGFGAEALNALTSGANNASVGISALLDTTTGSNNVAFGAGALSTNTTGAQNVGLGASALNYNTTGTNNVAIGVGAGATLATSANGSTNNQTASNSLYIGGQTEAQAAGDTNEVVIGSGAIGNGSNTVTLGSSATTMTYLQGNVTLAGTGASLTFNNGSVQTIAWTGVLGGGDYAESVNVTGSRAQYEPGDVLVVDPDVEGRFAKSSTPYSTAVMGIYSTHPGVVGRRQMSDRSHMAEEVPMAMIGVVPTKVTAEGGPIKPGDLLVTSSKRGYAMKGSDHTQMMGAIIGKALGHLDAGVGIIEVAVSLQ